MNAEVVSVRMCLFIAISSLPFETRASGDERRVAINIAKLPELVRK
jgi:hypothetical protein